MRRPQRNTLLVALMLAALVARGASAEAPLVFEKPGMITSIGQSSDIAVVKVLLNTKLKLGFDVKPLAQPDDLGATRTLVVVIGA
ncbi:MAG: DUF6305 family protein, partial [Acidobacteriota bacterium]